MKKHRPRPGPAGKLPRLPDGDPPAPTLEDGLEEAADLLAQQEPPEPLRPDPATPTDYGNPSLIDPAD